MTKEHSRHVPESELELVKSELKKEGYRESKGVLPILNVREYSISPHFSINSFEQTVNPKGEEVWIVSYREE